MEHLGLHGRHRRTSDEISRKHGKTFIRTLRSAYWRGFAEGAADNDRLENVIAELDEASLNRLVRDHERGHLEVKIFCARPAAR